MVLEARSISNETVQRRELARSWVAAEYEPRLMTRFTDFLDNHSPGRKIYLPTSDFYLGTGYLIILSVYDFCCKVQVFKLHFFHFLK